MDVLPQARCVSFTTADLCDRHEAGVRVVAVATGEYSIEQLREAGADWVVADLSLPLPF